MIFLKIWVLGFFFPSLSFLVKTCSVVNLPHKIHRNNFSLKKKKKRLSLYTISSGTLSWQCYVPLKFPHPGRYHFIWYPFLTHPSPSYMGTSSIDWQRKFTFLNKDAKYAKNINTDAKNKNKRETRQRKVFKLSSTCWNGGNRMIWDGICGEGRKKNLLLKKKVK